MKKFKSKAKILVNLFCSLGVFQQVFAETYIVKKGDVLSKILYDRNLKPIYGKDGTLLRVVAINKKLKSSNGNIIYPGMELSLDVYNNVETKNDSLSEVQKPDNSLTEAQPSKDTSDQKNESEINSTINEIPSRSIAFEKILSRSDFSIAGLSEFLRVKSTDTSTGASATFLSDASFGFNLAWGQNWSDNLRSSLSFQSIKVNIQDSSSATKTLTNKENTLTNYQFGFDYKYTTNFKFNGSVEYGESLVSRSVNTSEVTIEKFITPSLNTGFEYKIYQIDNLSLKVLGGVSLIMPSKQESYDSKLSLGKKVGFRIADSVGTFKIDGGLFFQETELEMKNSNYNQTNVGIMIGIKKGFGMPE